MDDRRHQHSFWLCSRAKWQLVIFWLSCTTLVGCQGLLHWPERSRNPAPARSLSSTYIEVRSGDTLYSLAFARNLDYRKVARWNNISAPYVIRPGQKLRMKPPVAKPKRNKAADSQASSPKLPKRKQPLNSSGKRKNQLGAPERSAAGVSWRWPANGRLEHHFGRSDVVGQGLQLYGRFGQPVQAAAAGKVVYAGGGLVGYGMLIIVKHNDNFLSAYAHNRVIAVQEGETVKAGQRIAEMGRGPDKVPLLHFEIRLDGEPVDPLSFLPRNPKG